MIYKKLCFDFDRKAVNVVFLQIAPWWMRCETIFAKRIQMIIEERDGKKGFRNLKMQAAAAGRVRCFVSISCRKIWNTNMI